MRRAISVPQTAPVTDGHIWHKMGQGWINSGRRACIGWLILVTIATDDPLVRVGTPRRRSWSRGKRGIGLVRIWCSSRDLRKIAVISMDWSSRRVCRFRPILALSYAGRIQRSDAIDKMDYIYVSV